MKNIDNVLCFCKEHSLELDHYSSKYVHLSYNESFGEEYFFTFEVKLFESPVDKPLLSAIINKKFIEIAKEYGKKEA